MSPRGKTSRKAAGKPAVPQAVAKLSYPGPHEVLRGDLALVGLPGVVYAPRSGRNLPAVAFGHGWLQPSARYSELLRHLASWGIVVAAPDTHRGPLPSHRAFVHDLRTALDVCAGVQLGDGHIRVDPGKLGLVGHSMGAGCAVLAAAEEPRCRAVVTLALAGTIPSAVDAAQRCSMPALHVAAGKDRVAPSVGNAEPVATAWPGPVQLRTIRKASHLGFTHGKHWSDLLIDGAPEFATRRLSRTLVTAFLLRHLADEREHDALLHADIRGAVRAQLPVAA